MRAMRKWHLGIFELINDSLAMATAGLPLTLIFMGIFIGITGMGGPIGTESPSMPHLQQVTVDMIAMLGCFVVAGVLFYAFKKRGLWQSVSDGLNSDREITNGRLH